MTAIATRRPGPIARLVARLRERGPRATIAKLFADRIFRASESVMMEVYVPNARPGRGDDLPPGTRMVMVRGDDELPPLGAFLSKRRRDFRGMLAAGKIGTFALVNGVAVGCAWASLTDHHERRAREFYPVARGEAYAYCFLVDPDWRRHNIALPLYRFTVQMLVGFGVTRLMVIVDRVNRVSYLIQKRFGGHESGLRVRHYHLFGQRWTRMSRYEGELGLAPDAR